MSEPIIPDAIGVVKNGCFYDLATTLIEKIQLEERDIKTQVSEYNAGNRNEIKFNASTNIFSGPW